jgi:uncharacterized protein with NAD-binding domain and iron-sulfur cluster
VFEARELDERSFWDTLKNDFTKVEGVVAPIAGIASKFIREEPEFGARELDERSFWDTLKNDFTKVEGVVAPIAGIASKFIREEPEFIY